ncbi:MAG TPA: EVE domain-containing protein [Telluria sp.]|nr:EVE domain-containing protein [Telluria sp.]
MQQASLFPFPAPAPDPCVPHRNWIAVASAEHVRLGRAQGFMQVCHGKQGPLRRLRPGDRVVYYSPSERFGVRTPLQAFTAIGAIGARPPYQVTMEDGFCPFRRDVEWMPSADAPIAPLLALLEFTAGRNNWGYQMRFGLFDISDHDFRLIARAMAPAPPFSCKVPPGAA